MQRCWIDHPDRVVFFWSPKCGSTSLARFLADRFKPTFANQEPAEHRNWMNSWGFGSSFAIGYQLCVLGGYRAVAVVRHPFGRVLSAYLNKFVIYTGKPIRDIDDLAGFSLEFYQDFARRSGRASDTYEGLSFHEFISELYQVGIVEGRIADLNNHWRPQAPLTSFDLENFYSDVLRVDREPMHVGLSRVLGETIGEQDIPKANRTAYRPGRSEAAADLTRVNSLELPENFQPQNFHARDISSMVEELYRQDYRLFGYSPDPSD